MSLGINDLQIFASLNDQSLGDLPIQSMLVRPESTHGTAVLHLDW